MKKLPLMLLFVVTFFALSAVSASALPNDTVKVGLRYSGTAMFSANLENAVGEGYSYGFFDEERVFQSVGETYETTISMTAAGDIYVDESGAYSPDMPEGMHTYLGAWHVQYGGYETWEDAVADAEVYGGWPAWIDWAYVVRTGSYATEEEALAVVEEQGFGEAVRSSDTGVIVTVTKTDRILFEFDTAGEKNLGILPISLEEDSVTWFKGYQYYGGFEYPRPAGGNLSVYNVVDLEAYVTGVVPFEMSDSWPLAALEAQAVCARTYACRDSRHFAAHGFDVCNTTDCQVYFGLGNGSNGPGARTREAVANTAGMCLYYDGILLRNAVYHSSNGGATEDIVNVWGSTNGYLVGKEDPYEAQTKIYNYGWTVTYTAEELTDILQQKNYDIGTVENVYVSEFTSLGNVREITFVGSRDNLVLKGEPAKTIFYSSTYGKSARSMRFGINGSGPAATEGSSVYVNDAETKLSGLSGVSVLTADGLVSLEEESVSVITAEGVASVTAGGAVKPTEPRDGEFVLSGTGSGHNLGMSQYGAKAMAELGHTYEDILNFYYTDITIE